MADEVAEVVVDAAAVDSAAVAAEGRAADLVAAECHDHRPRWADRHRSVAVAAERGPVAELAARVAISAARGRVELVDQAAALVAVHGPADPAVLPVAVRGDDLQD